MCRNIKTLFNVVPAATNDDIRALLQFVRKLSGLDTPSNVNQAVFAKAVDDVARAATALIASLVTSAVPRERAIEARRDRARMPPVSAWSTPAIK